MGVVRYNECVTMSAVVAYVVGGVVVCSLLVGQELVSCWE